MRRLVDAARIRRFMAALGDEAESEFLRRFEQIEPQLYRFPAIDPATFRRAVEGIVR